MITELTGASLWSEDRNNLLWIATLKEPEGKMVQRFQSSGGA